MSFDKNKPHGFVVAKSLVTEGDFGTEFVIKGNLHEGFIDSDGDLVVHDEEHSTWNLTKGEYKIIHDLRAPVKMGEKAMFSHNGNDWRTRTFLGVNFSEDRVTYMAKPIGASDSVSFWSYIKAIDQKPNVEIKVTINGEEVTKEEALKILKEDKG